MFEWFFGLHSAVQAGMIALLGTAISVGSVVMLDRRKANRDWLKSASDAEINSRAKLVGDMASHITQLQKDLGNVNDQLEELRVKEFNQMRTMRQDMELIDKRWRHLANNLIFYNQFITKKLRELGQIVPPFAGFKKFMEEGGDIRQEWLDELNIDEDLSK